MVRKRSAGLPNRKQILDFIATSDQPAGKREIARAFGLSGQDKILLKSLLKDMADEGLIDSAPGRAFHKAGGVPKVTVLRIVEADDSGNIFAVPEQWHADGPPPRLRVIERGRRGALGIGDRILARTEERGQGYVAHPMKKLMRSAELVLGVVKKEGERFWLTPVEKKERRELAISDLKDAEPGDLVLCEVSGRPPRVQARVDAVLGDPFAPRSFSLIAIHKHGLRHEFRQEAIDGAHRVAKLPLGEREDLTHLPIVAIDPADARDHDDAIWAAPDDDEDNKGGWKAIVAIADVSYYVRPGSELDREARARGNSVYFPDRVVPMLSEELSADICSLKEGQVRAAMACHLKIAKDGSLKSWRFTRAKICVAANIAYEDAQAAIDAAGEEKVEVSSPTCSMPEVEGAVPQELVRTALQPLWGAWRAMLAARNKREPLELDIPERRVMLDEKGRITSIAPRDRLDAHRLVEDFMIAANVAAARALEAKKAPVMYRVHEGPSREKLVALKDYLATFDLEFALGQVVKPSTFNRIIERIGDSNGRAEIMEQLLRTQMQARYGPERLGHFGLALATYAHFTSPIRRYADLLVHRALVTAYKLGDGGLPPGEEERFEEIGEKISMLERRAMEAERETIDRYVAAFLADQVGQLVECRITGVQPFGFFATVEDLGGDGLVLASTLGQEYFRYDEAARQLVGEESGETYRVGQRLTLRLAEANPVSGSLRFELPEGSYGGPRSAPQRRDRVRSTGRRGRPANIRHDSRRR
ncbi:VacB/RNase II family 3'-5' exoribonuclease [Sphingomonas sp. SM33]|uniref:Ribonuclease R n=1 Tax=Sphingomonas telluris TaxID=2907998 RepID=A0ABS9VME9_9SPHN|nr:VacB/RNase II family 3'-5' exoribonuclease [Sphingomonas telluris]MCH8616140.1 VacB/RNase II family 3'-5' exoribonuclease [Sphingomonas telluris]